MTADSQKPRRPAIYVRVSTDEQAQWGTSLETQLATLREDLAAEGAAEPLVFIDDGYSGSSPTRPGLMELESAVTNGLVSEVRVAALDRLARDLVLQETLLNRWSRQGIGFKSRREPDLGSADPTRVLIRQVLGAISQYERAVIAARMLAGRIAPGPSGVLAGRQDRLRLHVGGGASSTHARSGRRSPNPRSRAPRPGGRARCIHS